MFKKFVHFIKPPIPTLNLSSTRNLSKVRQLLEQRHQSKSVDILNIGSGDGFTKGVRALGPELTARIRNLDIFPGDNVDIVASAEAIPLDDNSVDCVIAEAVLPEIPDANQAIREMQRVLKDDGLIYIDTPFLQPIYRGSLNRYTLESLIKNFEFVDVVDSGISCGPSSVVSWLLIEYLTLALSFQNRFLESVNRMIWGWLLFPIKYLDILLIRNKNAYKIASGVYIIGRKKPSQLSDSEREAEDVQELEAAGA